MQIFARHGSPLMDRTALPRRMRIDGQISRRAAKQTDRSRILQLMNHAERLGAAWLEFAAQRHG